MTKYQSPRMARIELKHPGLSSLITRINRVAHKAYVTLLGEQNKHVVIDVTTPDSVKSLKDQSRVEKLNKAIGHMRLLQPTVIDRTMAFMEVTTLSDKAYGYHYINALGDMLNNTAGQYQRWIRGRPRRLAAHEAKCELFYAWKRMPWNALAVLVMAYPGSDVAEACQNLSAILYDDLDSTIAHLELHQKNLILMHKVLDSIEAFMRDVEYHDRAHLELQGEAFSKFSLNRLALGRRGLVALDQYLGCQFTYLVVERNNKIIDILNATGKALQPNWVDFNYAVAPSSVRILHQYKLWQKTPKLQATLRDVYVAFEGNNVVLRVPNLKVTIDPANLARIDNLLTMIHAVSTFVYAANNDFSGSGVTASSRIAHWEKMSKHFEDLQDDELYHELHDTLLQLTGFSLLVTMGDSPEPTHFPVDSPYQTVTEVLELPTMVIKIETYGPLATALTDMVRMLKSIERHQTDRGGLSIKCAITSYTSVLEAKEILDRKVAENGITAAMGYLNTEVKSRFKPAQFVLIKDLFYKGCQ